jgi:hypothetical protein
VLELQDGTRKSDKQFSYSFKSTSNQPTPWLILCWSTFGGRTSYGRLRTHKIHHCPDSGEATTFPHIVYSAALHGGYIQMAFCPGTPKGKSRNCQSYDSRNFVGAIILCLDLRLGWGLKQSCSSHWELSNSVLHATCTYGSRVDSRLFVVESQTTNLTPDLSFCHNLCYRCPNGSCKPILNIYTSIAFQWYKKLLNAKCFDLCNRSLKV